MELRYQCKACGRESLLRSGPNPAVLFVLVFIPLIAFTFSGIAYVLPVAFGIVGWLAASVISTLIAYAGLLTVQRMTYRFAPKGTSDA